GVGAGLIVDDLTYSNIAGYLELETLDYIIEVRDETGTTTVAAYQAPLATLDLEGAAITVLASGFLNPANNSDGPAFGLYAATATGGDLIPLPVYEEEPATVVDIITGSDVHTTLATAVTEAGLVETLQGEGPFTVFAPTDDAFDALPAGLLDDLLDDPTGLLTDILLYHVVGAYALSTDLVDGQEITTLLGEDVVVTITNGSVFINDAEVILADLEAGNGVVHVIDAVLVPSYDVQIIENDTYGNILTDGDGNTLYFFSLDADGSSACVGGCLDNWPLFYDENLYLSAGLDPDDFDSIDRGDGVMQTTYKGWPLYFFANDNEAGDVNGEGVINKWFVAKPDYTVMLTDNQLVGADGVNYTGDYTEGDEITQYLVDAYGNTLYTWTNDRNNRNRFTASDFSNNSVWPIFDAEGMIVPSTLNADDFGVIDVFGESQLTFKGWPLYNFGQDNMRGETKGVSVPSPGVWPVPVPDMMEAPAYTVVDIVVSSPNHETLTAAVTAAELVETLQGEGPFTVFAPTDDAFDALPDGLLDDLLDDPSGDLTDILLYHVVGAFALSTDLEDGQEITTLLGQDVVVTITNGSVFINDAEVTLADLEADNGVVHVIDAVLIPEEEPEFARAQIIHNAADMAAANVDVFVNGEIFVPDFAFRTATPFVDVPAGVELTIDIAPAGAGIESSVFDINITFEADETYVIVANGIVSETGYDPIEPFTVYPFAGAREAATDENETDVLVFHGSTDAPEVSVWETGVGAGELFTFDYGDFAGYLELGALDYILEVRTADGETTVAAYEAPLQTLGLEGAAITVVASGFLNPANNSDGPAFGLYVALAGGGDLIALPVYEEQEPVIVGFPFSDDLETPENYNNWIIIDGSGEGFVWEIGENANFNVSDPMDGSFAYIDSDAAGSGNYVWSILQAPIIDLADFEGDNIELSFAHHYRQIGEAQEAYVKISNDGENWETIATYNTDQGSSTGFSGPFDVTAVTESLIIEGYTSSDSLWIRFEFDDNEAWGWYWLVDNISVDVASDEPEFARAQIIHNAADMAAANVDVFVNGEIFVPDFAFRTATPFVDVPAGVELTFDVAPAGAGIESSVFDITVTFDADETYVIVANGIVSETGYDPIEPFTVYPFAGAREAATDENETDVLVFHGATDAPEVSVWETGVGAGELFTFGYGDFAGYLELGTLDYVLEVRTADGETTVAAYEASLQTLGLDGAAITVVASGFLNPANNSDGPAFGLYVATAAGGDLIALPVYEEPEPATARVQIIHNSADAAAAVVDVWVNETKLLENFAFRTATPFIDAPAGVLLNIGIAPPNSTSITQSFSIKQYVLTEDQTYVIVATGITSTSGYSPSPTFDIKGYPVGRETASQPENTDILVMHGATDAPTVDIYETGVGAGLIVDDLTYGNFAGYLELETLDYIIEVRDETGTTTVAAYQAPLATLGLEGAAISVLASGFLNPANNSDGPAFGLYVATAAGGDLIALPVFTNVNDIVPAFGEFNAYPNP
ncbi:MAG: fasciclin domain-containing protein, partial [Actinobacteria bacterium]|nr:fasciclin domain-containing protein [Actinomycetota bacterium]